MSKDEVTNLSRAFTDPTHIYKEGKVYSTTRYMVTNIALR